MRPNTCGIALLLLLALAAAPAQPAWAQTYTVLHTLTGPPDGAVPGPLIGDEQGTFYGTTRFAGLANCGEGTCGTVFKIDSAGNETVLFDFPGGNFGTNPLAGLARDLAGNLYGTTQGNGSIGGGSVVFKIDPKGEETVLFVAGTISQGCCLDSPVALDEEGNVYGMSPFAGDEECSYGDGLGCGTLFKLSPGGKFTLLHTFHGKDGSEPEGGVVLDAKGTIYGTAYFGGKPGFCHPSLGDYQEDGCGTIYKVDTSGKFTVLHTFAGPGDGAAPLGLTIDSAGNLYGITQWGGDDKHYYDHLYGYGTVFKLDASGKFSVLFTFTPKTTHQNLYASHLLRDSKGNLYGLESALSGGCLFMLDPQGNFTDLYNFQGFGEGADGNGPTGIVFGPDGDFYGSMLIGGFGESQLCDPNGCGSVFHLSLR